jgi:hypothetical protein
LFKGNLDKQQVTLTVSICAEDNQQNSTDVLGVPLSSNALTSASNTAVSGLPREDKERLLRELARECGYLLQPATHAREDFQKKLFLDDDE